MKLTTILVLAFSLCVLLAVSFLSADAKVYSLSPHSHSQTLVLRRPASHSSFTALGSFGRLGEDNDDDDADELDDDDEEDDNRRRRLGRLRDDDVVLTEAQKKQNEDGKKEASREGGLVELRGRGSEISMRGSGKNREGKFWKLKIKRISDSDGQRLKDLDGLDFTWSTPSTVTVDGKSATKYSVSAAQNVEGTSSVDKRFTMSLEVLLFTTQTEVPYGNSTRIKVTPEDVKYTLKVENWPWTATNTQKRLFVRFRFRASGKAVTEQTGTASTNQGVVKFGDLLADMPLVAIADGTEVPIEIKYEFEVEDKKKEKDDDDDNDVENVVSNVLFVFPRFNDTLVYDPVMSVDNAGFGVFGSSLAFVILAVLAAILLQL